MVIFVRRKAKQLLVYLHMFGCVKEGLFRLYASCKKPFMKRRRRKIDEKHRFNLSKLKSRIAFQQVFEKINCNGQKPRIGKTTAENL